MNFDYKHHHHPSDGRRQAVRSAGPGHPAGADKAAPLAEPDPSTRPTCLPAEVTARLAMRLEVALADVSVGVDQDAREALAAVLGHLATSGDRIGAERLIRAVEHMDGTPTGPGRPSGGDSTDRPVQLTLF